MRGKPTNCCQFQKQDYETDHKQFEAATELGGVGRVSRIQGDDSRFRRVRMLTQDLIALPRFSKLTLRRSMRNIYY